MPKFGFVGGPWDGEMRTLPSNPPGQIFVPFIDCPPEIQQSEGSPEFQLNYYASSLFAVSDKLSILIFVSSSLSPEQAIEKILIGYFGKEIFQ